VLKQKHAAKIERTGSLVTRDYAAIAKRYRDQAEEFRAKGGLMGDPETRDQYGRMADAYEKLAENEDYVGRVLKGLR